MRYYPYFTAVQFSLVQSLIRVWLFVTPWTAARQASLSFTNSRNFTQTHLHRVSDAIQPSHPLSSPSPAFNLSKHQVPVSQFLASGGQSIGVSASASVLSMNIQNWFPVGLTDLISLQSQGILKSLLQHSSSKASVRQHSVSLWSNSHIHIWLLEKP